VLWKLREKKRNRMCKAGSTMVKHWTRGGKKKEWPSSPLDGRGSALHTAKDSYTPTTFEAREVKAVSRKKLYNRRSYVRENSEGEKTCGGSENVFSHSPGVISRKILGGQRPTKYLRAVEGRKKEKPFCCIERESRNQAVLELRAQALYLMMQLCRGQLPSNEKKRVVSKNQPVQGTAFGGES